MGSKSYACGRVCIRGSAVGRPPAVSVTARYVCRFGVLSAAGMQVVRHVSVATGQATLSDVSEPALCAPAVLAGRVCVATPVYMYLCICICIYVYIYLYTIYLSIYVYISIYIYIYIYMYSCQGMYA